MNRWTGALFGLPLLGVTVYVLLSFSDVWPGQWTGTVSAVTGSTVLTGPVAAAAAAQVGYAQHRLLPLTASTPRGSLVPLRVAAAAWTWAVAAYLVGAAGAFAVTAVTPHGGPFAIEALPVGLGVLAVCSAAGALAVRIWPHRMTVVLAGPAVFLASGFGPAPYAGLLRPGPSTGSLAGLEYDPGVLILSGLALGGILGVLVGASIGAADVLPRPQLHAGSWGWSALLVGGLAVAVIAGAGLRGSGSPDGFRVSAERPTACRGVAPRVCLAPSDRRWLDVTAVETRRAAAPLVAAGIVLPDRYEQLLPGYHPIATVGLVEPITASAGSVFDQGVANVTTPAACSAWTDPAGPPEKAFVVQEVIGDWIRVRLHRPVPARPAGQRSWLANTDPAVATRWVADAFESLRRCRFDELRLPWPNDA